MSQDTRSRPEVHLLAAALGAALGCGAPAPGPAPLPFPLIVRQVSGTTALLQAVSAVDERVIWVSGHRGTFARTTDGGLTWRPGRVPGADSLQFRDVYGADSLVAYLLAAGPGARSRIYKTTDGGATWALQFTNPDSSAFYDCFGFWDAKRGLAFSDAVDGRAVLIATEDGGAHWSPVAGLPAALPNEGGFAASGGCVVTAPGGRAWVGTGNGASARVLRTADYGRTWQVAETPIAAGEAAGITALAFRDPRHGLAVGGHLGPRDPGAEPRVVLTEDGGATWRPGGRPSARGALHGVAVAPGGGEERGPGGRLLAVAVGPGGADWSRDGGLTWAPLDSAGYWSVAFGSPRAAWAVGPGGRIARFAF